MVEFLQFVQQAMMNGGRSTVLKPLAVALGLLLGGLAAANYAKLDPWIISALAILTLTTGILYLVTYVYFVFKDPDALRSETFAIQKLAIEKRLVGDNVMGIVKASDLPGASVQSQPQLGDKDQIS